MLKSELDVWKQRQGGGEMRLERCTKDWVRRGEGKVKLGMIHSSGSELLLTKKLQEKWECNGTWTRCALLCIQYIQPYLVASHLSCCLMLSCLFMKRKIMVNSRWTTVPEHPYLEEFPSVLLGAYLQGFRICQVLSKSSYTSAPKCRA